MPHTTAGEVKLVASPLKLGATPVVDPRAPPLSGGHSDEVPAEIGYDPDRIAALRRTGAIA